MSSSYFLVLRCSLGVSQESLSFLAPLCTTVAAGLQTSMCGNLSHFLSLPISKSWCYLCISIIARHLPTYHLCPTTPNHYGLCRGAECLNMPKFSKCQTLSLCFWNFQWSWMDLQIKPGGTLCWTKKNFSCLYAVLNLRGSKLTLAWTMNSLHSIEEKQLFLF